MFTFPVNQFSGQPIPPTPVLLEGFENVPLTATPPITSPWIDSGTPTITRTSSHVTQGSFSWRIQDTVGNRVELLCLGSDISSLITTQTNFLIDVFIQTINVLDTVAFGIGDGFVYSPLVYTTTGATGAFTLSRPVSGFNLSAMEFSVFAFDAATENVLTGTVDFYIDNLRAE